MINRWVGHTWNFMKLCKALCLCRLAWPSWVRQGVWVAVSIIQMSTQFLKKWLGSRHMAVLSLFSSTLQTPNSSLLCNGSQPKHAVKTHSVHLPSPFELLPTELGHKSLGEVRRRGHFLLCAGNRYCGKAKVRKPWSVSPRPRWRPFWVFLQKNTQTTLLRKATAVQFLLYSWPIANMFSDCS